MYPWHVVWLLLAYTLREHFYHVHRHIDFTYYLYNSQWTNFKAFITQTQHTRTKSSGDIYLVYIHHNITHKHTQMIH